MEIGKLLVDIYVIESNSEGKIEKQDFKNFTYKFFILNQGILHVEDGTSFKMISFISGTLLKEEPHCKFMLKHDTKNYFHNLGKL